MIISSLLKQILQPFEITYNAYNSYKEPSGQVTKEVRFGYGDEHELKRFISKNRTNENQFPLIWYVMPEYERDENALDRFDVNCELIFMTSTTADLYNEERNLYNYSEILNQLVVKSIKKLQFKRNVLFVGKSKEKAYPNYGINDESETPLVYVDALSSQFQLIIKTPC